VIDRLPPSFMKLIELLTAPDPDVQEGRGLVRYGLALGLTAAIAIAVLNANDRDRNMPPVAVSASQRPPGK